MSVSTTGSSALPEFEEELEDELEGEDFDLGGLVSGLLGEGELELEYEDEYELEDEWEGEFSGEAEGMANPLSRVYPDAMMEHLGHAAAEAESEAEAEAFIGALVPLAAGLARKAAPLVARSTPHLVRGLSTVAHALRRHPATKPLVRALPTVAARTTRALARDVARGHHVTPRRAVRALAGQTRAVLADPRTRHHVVRRARALDRTYHRAARNGQWWTGAVSVPSGSAVRGLVSGPAAAGGRVPVRYGTPGTYRYGPPGSYRYGTPAGYRYGVPGQVVTGRPARRPGQQRRRRYPPGLSIAWVPVPAWSGSRPPSGTYRY